MRLMIVVLAITFLVVVDQYKGHGYYRNEVSRWVSNIVRSVI